MPGRPPVQPYLHGIAEWQPPETYVAWREEVEIIAGDLLDLYAPEDLLDDYPLLPHELLRDRSARVFKQLETLAQRNPDSPAWLIDERGVVHPTTLGKLADKDRKSQIDSKTILLPPSVGGLANDGMLDGNSPQAGDIADAAFDECGRRRRQRKWDEAPVPEGLRIIRTIDTKPDADESRIEEEGAPRRLWQWFERPREGGSTASQPVSWDTHVGDVVDHAKRILAGLSLPDGMADAVILAAKLHDRGKKRELFQLTLGNREYPHVVLAKSNGRAAARFSEPFRHEFASVLDARRDSRFAELGAEMQDLVLHLIAAHHGRARPHFSPEEAFDPEPPSGDTEKLSVETPRRFARLQRKYGRWGLAYLESLVRAADWAASAAEGNATT
jgi:CRISPR-associated endonuclease/helicase Cas3